MKIYYVTGIFGSGKSAVCEELKKRGYVSYDDDEHNITQWREKETGNYLGNNKRVAGPNGSKLELYDWHISTEKILELTKDTNKEVLFMCGTATNRHEIWNLFEKVFLLHIDETTLRRRLDSRTGNDFGKDSTDLKDILNLHKELEQTDIDAGAIVISGTDTVDKIADKIIASIS
jgi:dephospho-CoA kinase